MAEADVIIAWGHGPVPDSVKGEFKRPTKFLTLSNPNWKSPLEGFNYTTPIQDIVAKYAPGTTPLRVAALGFSASCQGVAALLGSPQGGWFDAAVAIDGIHTGLPVSQAGMTPWFNYGKLAVVNERLLAITHSSVVPPNYASTTQTANWLWDTLTGGSDAFTDPPVPAVDIPAKTVSGGPAGSTYPVQYPAPALQPPKRAGGLVVLGFNNLDKPAGYGDHRYQAQAVLPWALKALLAARWNAMDPHEPGQACFTG